MSDAQGGFAPHGGARWCDDHRRWECVHRKHGGSQCHGSALRGLDSCKIHVGNKDRILAGRALAARYGHWSPIEIHPAEALLQEVYYWTGLCAFLDHVVAGLQQADMVWGVTRRKTVVAGQDSVTQWEQVADLNTWVRWQQDAHRDKARVCRLALESDADARMLDLAEATAARWVQVWEEGLVALDLSPGQWELAREVFPRLAARLAA